MDMEGTQRIGASRDVVYAAKAAPDSDEKKLGWFGKAMGLTSALVVGGGLLTPGCCLVGHVHAAGEPTFPICRAHAAG